MLDLKILRICKILNLEEFLDLLHTCSRKIYDLVLLIDDKVSCLLLLNAHDKVHLGHLRNILTALHLSCQYVTDFVKLRGLAALSGNDKRCSCLINQHGIDLINNGIM